MNRHSLWIMPALALTLAGPAIASDDNEKEKNQNRARREAIYGDDDYRYDDGRFGTARRNGNMRFRGMDRNGDGRITRREWNGNDKSFRQHDANRDGVLSGREVRVGNSRNRDVFIDDRGSFGRLDRNNDGVLEGREWPYGSIDFSRLDRNNNRVIENWEFRLQ
jgi:hypothetical protein